MKRRSFIQLSLLVSITTLATIACDQFSSNNNQPIKIGSILTLTGPAGLIGQEILAGQKLAVDYWNSKEGAKIQFVSQDSKNQPKDGLSAYQALKAQGYNFFIANASGVALAIKAEVKGEQDTFIALAAHPRITDPVQSGVFRYSNTATGEAKALSDWISEKSKSSAKKVVLFHSADDYGYAFNKAMTADMARSDFKVVSREFRPEDVSNMRSLVQAILPKEPYIAVVVGAGQPMAQVISVLRTLGYQGSILANVGYALTGVQKSLGKDASNIVYLTLDVNQNKDTEWANQEYKKLYKKDITPDAIIGFNSVSLIVMTAKELKEINPSQVNQNLLSKAESYLGQVQPSNNEIVIKVKTNEN